MPWYCHVREYIKATGRMKYRQRSQPLKKDKFNIWPNTQYNGPFDRLRAAELRRYL
jgi:hypothetical protein